MSDQPKRKRTPGDEVESNLNERINRAKRQERQHYDRLAAGQAEESGIADPRYQMTPLKNDLEE